MGWNQSSPEWSFDRLGILTQKFNVAWGMDVSLVMVTCGELNIRWWWDETCVDQQAWAWTCNHGWFSVVSCSLTVDERLHPEYELQVRGKYYRRIPGDMTWQTGMLPKTQDPIPTGCQYCIWKWSSVSARVFSEPRLLPTVFFFCHKLVTAENKSRPKSFSSNPVTST